MLSRSTIDKVEDIPLLDIIQKYVDLKKKGSTYSGKSPFTEEKTGSFHVSPSKGMWKCFSSGHGGKSGIKFVMLKENCTYPEAIKLIASDHGIEIEYDDSDRAKKYQEEAEIINQICQINELAVDYYKSNISKIPAEHIRANAEMFEKFDLGYALNQWDGLQKFLREKGITNDQMIRSGLVVKGEKGMRDFFINRVMFPVHNTNGRVVGFSGRDVSGDDKAPKVINSKETLAYNKSRSLLGIFQSKDAIAKEGKAILVEGNYDVTSMHSQGLNNTIAPLGTAFTIHQALTIRKYCDVIVLMVDNDKAGKDKIRKNTELLLAEGFKVLVFIPGIEGSDPDDLVKSKEWEDGELKQVIEKNSVDAIEWLANELFKDAEKVFEKDNARKELASIVAKIKEASLRNSYTNAFSKKYQLDKASVESAISIQNATKKQDDYEQGGVKLPTHLTKDDIEDFREYGFITDKKKGRIGYYFPNGNSDHPERVSNFILKPLFQVSSMNDSKRIVELQNDRKKVLIVLPNKAIVSQMHFEEIISNQGNFWFHGAKKHFQKLQRKTMAQFTFVREIRTLGWQRSGFFAFANGIVDGNFKRVDDYGICQYGEEQFFLPAFSSVYSQLEEEEDVYESERYLIYRQSKQAVSFSDWTKQMIIVHGDNGMWAVLHFIAALFRDHVFSCLSFFPHMFGFGQPQTGKSACARAINSIFFGDQTPFNLSSGTQVSFYRKLAQFRNAVVWMDEYRNDIDPKRIQALKAGYDGAGHEKGVMSNDNRTTITKPNSAIWITGQHIPTVDESALFTRSIFRTFERKAQDVSIEERKEFEKLVKWQQEGLSHLIVEVIKYRDMFEDLFEKTHSDTIAQLKNDLYGQDYEGRIMENYGILITCNKLFQKALALPFDPVDTYKKAMDEIIKQSEQVTESDALRGYWKMIEFLSYQYGIKEHEDYVIQDTNSITIREGRDNLKTIDFGKTKRVLFLRFTKIHPLYMEAHRKQYGENGLNEQSIKSYMKTSRSFLGISKNVIFNGVRTTGYAFEYDMIGIDIKTEIPTEKKEETIKEKEDLPF